MSSQLANDRRIYLQTAADLSPHFPESAHLICVYTVCWTRGCFSLLQRVEQLSSSGCTHSSDGHHFHDLLAIGRIGMRLCIAPISS